MHKYAWNNLIFMHAANFIPTGNAAVSIYKRTIEVCNLAQQALDNAKDMGVEDYMINRPENIAGDNVNIYRYRAYAEFKESMPSQAITYLKKAIAEAPNDPENWSLWGMIMRSVGNYESARHKLKRALVLDPDCASAKFELEVLDVIVKMDGYFERDQVPEILKLRSPDRPSSLPAFRRNGVCGVVCEACTIF